MKISIMKNLGVFAALMVMVIGTTSLNASAVTPITQTAAGSTYAETSLPLPEGLSGDARIKGMYVHPNGSIDSLAEGVAKGGRGARVVPFNHYYSPDGGKTWNTKDTSWAKTYQKKYSSESSNIIRKMIADDKGNVFYTIDAGDYTLTSKKMVDTYPAYKVLKSTGGSISEIPNLTLKSNQVAWDVLIGVTENDQLVMSGDPWRADSGSPRVCVVDSKTGTVNADWKLSFVPRVFTNGQVYGYQWKNNKDPYDYFVAADITTGKETLKIKMDGTMDMSIFGLSAATDGTVYSANKKGLFRLRPGTSNFEKIKDSTACSFAAKNMSIYASASAPNGKTYVVAQYYNYTNENDPLNGTQSKLYCYSPA